MSESSSVVKKTIRRTGVSSVSPKEMSHVCTYQIYRCMSPTTSNRLEIRIKELEDAMEQKRAGRLRAEQELSEMS